MSVDFGQILKDRYSGRVVSLKPDAPFDRSWVVHLPAFDIKFWLKGGSWFVEILHDTGCTDVGQHDSTIQEAMDAADEAARKLLDETREVLG